MKLLTVITQKWLIDDTALALLSYIGYPDTSYSEAIGVRSSEQVFPEWLI